MYNEQTSPTRKAEPEAAASATTLANFNTSDLIRSHLPNMDSFVSVPRPKVLNRQNDIVFHKLASSFYLFTLTLDRSGVQPVIIQNPLPTTTGNMVTVYNRAGA